MEKRTVNHSKTNNRIIPEIGVMEHLAVLLLIHKDISHVVRLVNQLSHPEIDVFVHIDSKSEISDYDIQRLKNLVNVYVLDERISTDLDKWSLVEATTCLMGLCQYVGTQKNVHYSYFALMSGQDYPIKNIEYILNFLAKSYPRPLIDCTPYDRNNWIFHKFNDLPSKIMVNDYINQYFGRGLLRKAIKLPVFVYYAFIQLFINPYKKLNSINCTLYGGSAWWILPDLVVDYILKRLSNTEDEVIKILKDTKTPEETFFQIMTMQSPLADMCDVNPSNMVDQNCMTYAYFSDIDKPFKGHPYIFTVNEFEKILNLPHLFARKFDETVDSQILHMIDECILRNKVEI